MLRLRILIALAIAVTSATARAAEPQQEGVDVRTAREAFVLGTALAKRGQWREALAEFERSARLRAHPVTTYNVGFCERALGRYTRARARFAEALESAELPDELARSAKIYRLEADRRIARISVRLDPDAALSVDGTPLAAGEGAFVAGIRERGRPERVPSGRFSLLLDPGPHVFIVARRGAGEVVVERSFEAGATGSLELRPPTPPEKPKVASPSLPFGKTPGYVVVGAGAALITAGGVLGIVFLVNESDLDAACTDRECPTDRERQIEVTNAVGTASIVTLAVGAAALGTGIALAVKGRSDERGAIEAWIGPGRMGMRGAF